MASLGCLDAVTEMNASHTDCIPSSWSALGPVFIPPLHCKAGTSYYLHFTNEDLGSGTSRSLLYVTKLTRDRPGLGNWTSEPKGS